jgi:hypothetical protein
MLAFCWEALHSHCQGEDAEDEVVSIARRVQYDLAAPSWE